MIIHPASKILLWLGFAGAVQGLGFGYLLPLTLFVLLLLLTGCDGALGLVRRARWLLITMLLIYAFATPGDELFPQLNGFGPSLQGVQAGALQAWRLTLMLLALGVLLRSCPRNSLLGGLYTLLRPFRSLGLDVDRFAVRLWLTLQYAEQQPDRKMEDWWQALSSSFDPEADAEQRITLELDRFTWRDGALLVLAMLLIGLTFL